MKLRLLLTLGMFSLWDYYIPALGGRVLDYVGIALLFIFLGREVVANGQVLLRFSRYYVIWLFTLAPLIWIAYFQGGGLTATAFGVGAILIFGSFFYQRHIYGDLHKQIGWLIAIHLIFFFVQYGVYKVFGIVINYHGYFGALDPRTFNDTTGYFRAAGLFQEPNSFCLTLYMLNIVRVFLRESKPDVFFLASLFAMFASESLWGFAAIVMLVLAKANLFKVRIRNLATLFGIAVFCFAGWSVVKESPDILVSVLDPVTVERITNLENDPSRKGRFEGEANFEVSSLLFGRGISTNNFQTFLGANAIGFYIFSFGIMGLLFFVGWIISDTKKNRLAILATVLFAMTSYPLFTYAFWWAWLAILVQVNKIENPPILIRSISGKRNEITLPPRYVGKPP